MGLLLSAALGLAIVGVFQYIFYLDALPFLWQPPLRHGISVAIAAFFEALSLFFLITTVRDFSARHRREGWLGAVASILLLIYALYEVRHVAATFDRDTPETYATIYAILATIIVIVRVVELRIALTVTAAIIRHDERKIIADLTGKLAILHAEKDAAENRKRQAEEERKRLENERREQEITDAFTELETLRKRVAKQEKTSIGVNGVVTQEAALRIARDYMRKNIGLKPTQKTIAALMKKEDRTIRNAFPNGSWDIQIEQLFAEINNPQKETTEAILTDN